MSNWGAPEAPPGPLSLQILLGHDDACTAYPKLVAADCDVLEGSGRVDPMPALPVDVQKLLRDPLALLDKLNPGLATGTRIKRGDRKEYAKLVVRQLRANKIGLRGSVKAGASIFTIG